MQTIRRRILLPMTLLIVLVPLVTLLVFNIAMRLYVQTTARSNLKTAMLPLETLARQELTDRTGTVSESRLEQAALRLTRAVQASKLTGGRLLIYSSKENLAYPARLPDGFITDSLARQIGTRLKRAGAAGQVQQIAVNGQTCYFTAFRLSGAAGSHVTLVLASEQSTTRALIRAVNLILLVIMLVGIGIGIWVATRLSGRMAAAIGRICRMTEQIGRGKFPHFTGKPVHIRELDRLSASIAQMSGQLEASGRSQRLFLQNASHELRTPLMSIQGYAEGITSGVVPDVQKAAQIIESESRRLNALVEELLILSRIESGTIRRPVRLCLNELLPELVQRLGGLAMRRHRTITLDLPAEPVYLMGDAELIGQAVTNILSNCLRYAKAEILVGALTEDGVSVVRIADDGPGILAEDLPHLFERFYKGKGGNFGLGLAIAQSAVRMNGGEIRAYNSASGAVFDLIFRPMTR